MKNKQIKVASLGLFIAVFLTSGCINSGKIKQLENEVARLNQVILQKDAKIKTLTDQAQVKQKDLDTIKKELNSSKAELDGVKKELDNTKKELDKVNNKLKAPTIPPAAIKK